MIDKFWHIVPRYAESDVNCVDKQCNTPLYYAVSSYEVNIVNKLIQIGARVNVKCEDGNTPLHEAYKKLARCKDSDQIENQYKAKGIIFYLEKKFANPDALNFNGRKPVEYAREGFESV